MYFTICFIIKEVFKNIGKHYNETLKLLKNYSYRPYHRSLQLRTKN